MLAMIKMAELVMRWRYTGITTVPVINIVTAFPVTFQLKATSLPYSLCIVYHVETHQNSSGNVAIFMTSTVPTLDHNHITRVLPMHIHSGVLHLDVHCTTWLAPFIHNYNFNLMTDHGQNHAS